MFDLIGFWGNVTLLTALVIFPLLVTVVPSLIHHFVLAVTSDSELANTARDKVFKCKEYNYSGRDKSTRVLGVPLWEGFIVISAISGGILWLILTVPIFAPDRDGVHPWNNFAEGVSIMSNFFAPYTGELMLFGAVYFIAIILLRRSYKLYQKVEKVLEKVSESDS